jgi:hypothetical protein
MLHGRLLDKNTHRCESLANLPYPVVLLQGGQSSCDRFVECLRGDLYGVLNISKILYRNCARSKNHVQKRSRFAFCSPLGIRGLDLPGITNTVGWCKERSLKVCRPPILGNSTRILEKHYSQWIESRQAALEQAVKKT